MSEDSTDDTIGPIPPAYITSSRKPIGEKYVGIESNIYEHSIQQKENPEMIRKNSSKSSDKSDDSTLIGPVMPKHLKESNDKEMCQDRIVNVQEINKEASIIGPSLPSHLSEKVDEVSNSVDFSFKPISKPIMGPSLPPHLKLNANLSQNKMEEDSSMYGPALPPGFCSKAVGLESKHDIQGSDSSGSSSDDGEMGPLPDGISISSKVHHQLEMRAQLLRQSMANEKNETSEGPVRESWMLELPAHRAPELGLKSRQFRVRGTPDAGDRSVWTDTPADRERKRRAPKNKSPDRTDIERQATEKRDEFMQKLAEQHSSKRERQSLLALHEEKLEAKRKKKLEAGEVPERRPFSREIDLQVNRFDEAQKKSILKKAQHLNDRFSAGQSKFL